VNRGVLCAWLMDAYEGVDSFGEVPDPEPGPGQVLLRVRFAALNPADAFLAEARYPAKPPLPHILGRDGVGDVIRERVHGVAERGGSVELLAPADEARLRSPIEVEQEPDLLPISDPPGMRVYPAHRAKEILNESVEQMQTAYARAADPQAA
jgi:Alcohol dehydrogenase GroES-like domain